MEFNENNSLKKVGLISAFVLMYFIFTTALYFILNLMHKLPQSWSYWHLSIITIFIILLGSLIKLLLK